MPSSPSRASRAHVAPPPAARPRRHPRARGPRRRPRPARSRRLAIVFVRSALNLARSRQRAPRWRPRRLRTSHDAGESLTGGLPILGFAPAWARREDALRYLRGTFPGLLGPDTQALGDHDLCPLNTVEVQVQRLPVVVGQRYDRPFALCDLLGKEPPATFG